MFRPNALKERLQAGRKALGCWLFTNNAIAAEILGHAGYDFVMIDHEHGFGGFGDAVAQLQALQAFDATVLMRVPDNDPIYIKRALDIGAEGIMVPMVESAEQAQAAVAATRYPPAGIRGAATRVVRASDYGLRADDYQDGANDQMFVLCQIETPAAVEAIPAIAAVDGVDCLFIGPNDLATTMGHGGDMRHPEVAAMLAKAEAAILASGRTLGVVPHAGLDWQACFDKGYELVVAGSDISLLREAARADVTQHRERNG